MNGASRGRPTFGPETRAASGPWPFAIVAVVSFGAVAAALVTQHVYGMQPCPWCVLQRLVFVGIGAFALMALEFAGRRQKRVSRVFTGVPPQTSPAGLPARPVR